MDVNIIKGNILSSQTFMVNRQQNMLPLLLTQAKCDPAQIS
jgi:hypothetical protein